MHPQFQEWVVLIPLLIIMAHAEESEEHDEHVGPPEITVSVGGGPLVHEPLTVGINARVYLNIGEHFCFGPEVSVLAPFDETHDGTSTRVSGGEANLMGHYVVEVAEPFGVYPLFGAGVDVLWEDGEGPEVTPRVRVGGGFHLGFERWSPFLEYQLSAPGPLEHAIVLGALVHLGG